MMPLHVAHLDLLSQIGDHPGGGTMSTGSAGGLGWLGSSQSSDRRQPIQSIRSATARAWEEIVGADGRSLSSECSPRS